MKRFFSIVFGASAMLIVALVSAFFTMRLSIHGREVDVPNFSGMTLADATKAAGKVGLNLNVENHFYSTAIPAGHVLSQSPAAGSRVRRDSPIRLAESLGLQKVEIPNVVGQSQRAAAIEIRRLGLELGTIAHIASGGDADMVLAQTPPPNSAGVDSPRVSLLISQAEDSSDLPAFIMPSITGQTLAAAGARLAEVGLRIAVVEDPSAAPPDASAGGAASAAGAPAAGGYNESFFPGSQAPPPSVQPASPNDVVTAQSPLPGRRVTRADAIHVAIGRL